MDDAYFEVSAENKTPPYPAKFLAPVLPPGGDDEAGYDADLLSMRHEQCFGCCMFGWASDLPRDES